MATEEPVEVRRSARRRRTLTVFRERGRLVALVPQRLTRAQEVELVPTLVARFLRREAAAGARPGDADLAARAVELYRRYLLGPAGVPMPACRIRWVDNQQQRWGSCTADTGEIRLSSRLASMPSWVRDYVLLHELAHLIEPNHSPRFHALLDGYPRLAEAKAFLRGYAHAVHTGATGGGLDPDQDAGDAGEAGDGPDAF